MFRTSAFAIILSFVVPALATAADVYENSFETTNPLRYWTSTRTGKYKIHHLGLTDKRAHSGKQSVKLDVTLNLSGHCYFDLPVDVPLEADRRYYVSAWVYVERLQRGGRREIGVGANRTIAFGTDGSRDTSGCNLFDSVDQPTGKWRFMESLDIRQVAVAQASTVGLPTNRLKMDKVFIGLQGEFPGQRVTVFLDDVRISHSPTEKLSEPQVKRFDKLDGVFPFGIYGSIGGFRSADASGTYNEKFPEPIWRALPMWKRNHVNVCIGEAGSLYPDSPTQRWDDLDRTLDIFDANDMYLVPTTWLTRFYRSDLTYDACHAAIQKIVPRFAGRDSLLAWCVIDEPPATKSALQDYLWGKREINKLDPTTPVITGGNKANYLFDRHRPVALFDRYPLRENFHSPWSIANITRAVYEQASGPVWWIAPAFHNTTGEYPRPTRAEFRLMSYAALANGAKGLIFFNWRSRPSLFRHAGVGLLDTMEMPSELWDEMRSLGDRVCPLGQQLLTTRVVPDPPLAVESETIELYWEQTAPAIATGLLFDKSRDIHFLLVYNNDTSRERTGHLTLGESLRQGRSVFDSATRQGVDASKGIKLTLRPGDARIFVLASPKEWTRCQQLMDHYRLGRERNLLKLDAYYATLSKLLSNETLSALAKSDDLNDLARVRKRLQRDVESHPKYIAQHERLNALQKKLAELHQLYEAKITSLESQARFPSPHPKREFDPADPRVRAYVDIFPRIGHIYFRLRNLHLKGGWREIGPDINKTESWVNQLTERAQHSFVTRKEIQSIGVPVTKLDETTDRLDELHQRIGPAWPNPTKLFGDDKSK